MAMHRNKSVDVHQFAMVPKADIPRSSFRMQKALKTAFNASALIPVFVEEILPGDTFNVRMTAFARLATPIFPIMDNLHLESFFFYVPNRLVWSNWQRFMGERDPNPSSSISYVVPQVVSPALGYTIGSIFDYMGLPTVGMVASAVSHSVLPLRGYNLIFNQWFRDENLVNSATINLGDGPDANGDYGLRRRGKRHDYFTSALPFVQKGTAVSLPLGTSAPVVSDAAFGGSGFPQFYDGISALNARFLHQVSGTNPVTLHANAGVTSDLAWYNPALAVDLSAATSATINQLRSSFQIQKLLERDARGGTRYTEIVRSHFGVMSPDARLQRPEYLGGGHTPININPIAQTSATTIDGSDTPAGSLAAFATALAQGHGFTQSFTEHGYVIGLVNVRADLTYQQGLRRHWSRSTRYDFYFPVFAMLGEQAILNKEIFCTGSVAGPTNDNTVFGYQERWAELRYNPSEITGLMRSTAANTIDAWHLAQNFVTYPALNQAFIEEDVPLERVLAVGADAGGQQLIADFFFDIKAARPLPLYSVPGLVDHF